MKKQMIVLISLLLVANVGNAMEKYPSLAKSILDKAEIKVEDLQEGRPRIVPFQGEGYDYEVEFEKVAPQVVSIVLPAPILREKFGMGGCNWYSFINSYILGRYNTLGEVRPRLGKTPERERMIDNLLYVYKAIKKKEDTEDSARSFLTKYGMKVGMYFSDFLLLNDLVESSFDISGNKKTFVELLETPTSELLGFAFLKPDIADQLKNIGGGKGKLRQLMDEKSNMIRTLLFFNDEGEFFSDEELNEEFRYFGRLPLYRGQLHAFDSSVNDLLKKERPEMYWIYAGSGHLFATRAECVHIDGKDWIFLISAECELKLKPEDEKLVNLVLQRFDDKTEVAAFLKRILSSSREEKAELKTKFLEVLKLLFESNEVYAKKVLELLLNQEAWKVMLERNQKIIKNMANILSRKVLMQMPQQSQHMMQMKQPQRMMGQPMMQMNQPMMGQQMMMRQPMGQPRMMGQPMGQPRMMGQPMGQLRMMGQPMGQPRMMGQPMGQLRMMGKPMGQPRMMGKPMGQPRMMGQGLSLERREDPYTRLLEFYEEERRQDRKKRDQFFEKMLENRAFYRDKQRELDDIGRKIEAGKRRNKKMLEEMKKRKGK